VFSICYIAFICFYEKYLVVDALFSLIKKTCYALKSEAITIYSLSHITSSFGIVVAWYCGGGFFSKCFLFKNASKQYFFLFFKIYF